MNIVRHLIAILLITSACLPAFPQRRATARAGQTIDLLILGGTIVTMDDGRKIIEDGAVAVKDGKIVSVGKAADMRGRAARQTVNAAGKVIIPGLINTHTHIPMVLFRGISDDLDLNEWLTKYIFRSEERRVGKESRSRW